MNSGTWELAVYGFVDFYADRDVLNWWYYLGPKAEYKNPQNRVAVFNCEKENL